MTVVVVLVGLAIASGLATWKMWPVFDCAAHSGDQHTKEMALFLTGAGLIIAGLATVAFSITTAIVLIVKAAG